MSKGGLSTRGTFSTACCWPRLHTCVSVCRLIDLVYGKRGLPIRKRVRVQTDAADTHASVCAYVCRVIAVSVECRVIAVSVQTDRHAFCALHVGRRHVCQCS